MKNPDELTEEELAALSDDEFIKSVGCLNEEWWHEGNRDRIENIARQLLTYGLPRDAIWSAIGCAYSIGCDEHGG